MYKIEVCNGANREHAKCNRQYAHTYHKPNVICISKELLNLPHNYVCGIILHEIGHIEFGDPDNHTENDADRLGSEISKIEIFRQTNRQIGKNLEVVKHEDLSRAKKFIVRNTNLRFAE